MSSEYEEYKARSEDELRIDSYFIATNRYYSELAQTYDLRTLGVGSNSGVDREEYAELIASVDLLRDTFSDDSDSMHDEANMPTMQSYINDKRQTIEQFKLLPLIEMSSCVDEKFPLERAQDWYEFVVQNIRKKDEFHGDFCLVIERKDSPASCSHSARCPYKVVRFALLSGAQEVSFNDPMYIIDPDRQKELVARKIDVAARSGVEQRHLAYAVLGKYRRMADFVLGH